MKLVLTKELNRTCHIAKNKFFRGKSQGLQRKCHTLSHFVALKCLNWALFTPTLNPLIKLNIPINLISLYRLFRIKNVNTLFSIKTCN